ncbi:MAG: hypothetical protein P8X88_08205 [Gammaproteobacteria bacterium]
MLKALGFNLILLLVLGNISQAFADEQRELKNFCMWKASAAQVIAMNRDLGLNETEITRQFLKQQTDYKEQLIVLYLIEKIYGNYKFVTHDTIYLQTNKTCLRDFYIDKTNKVFLSQHMDNDY